jgi:hypothetical protein
MRGGGGMMGGGCMMGGGAAAGAGAETTEAVTPKTLEPADPTVPEEKADPQINKFAALYGPTSLEYEETWDGRSLQWVTVTYDLDTSWLKQYKGRTIRLPLTLVMEADLMETLEGYFPIYAESPHRVKGEIVSSKTYTPAERVEKLSPKEVREHFETKRAAAAQAAAEQAAAGDAGAGGAAGGGPAMGGAGAGGGMRGGGMRGMGR